MKSWLNHDAFGKQSLREQTHLHKSILPVTSMNLSSCTCFPLALKIVRALHLFVNSFLPHAENTNRNTQTKLAYGTHGTHRRKNKIELASSATPLLYFAACGRAGPKPQCRVSCNTTRALPSRCWSSHNSTHSWLHVFFFLQHSQMRFRVSSASALFVILIHLTKFWASQKSIEIDQQQFRIAANLNTQY